MEHTPEFERAQKSARRLRFQGAVACVAILSAISGYIANELINPRVVPAAEPVEVPRTAWIAAAPGRVEPKSGEVSLSATIPGRIARVPVRVNDHVEEGEVLVRLDDEGARTRLASAEVEAAALQRERDAQPETREREALRSAEDAAYAAARTAAAARLALDEAQEAQRTGKGTAAALAEARRRSSEARARLDEAKRTLADEQSKPNLPAPSRLEVAVISARARVAAAQSLLDATRIRAPAAGAALELHAKVGEYVEPSPKAPLAIVGDPHAVEIKAEVDERDVAKLKVGQSAYVLCDAFPDKSFEGKVTRLAPALAPSRMVPRLIREQASALVMTATIEFESAPPLRPGQRVDVFFRPGTSNRDK